MNDYADGQQNVNVPSHRKLRILTVPKHEAVLRSKVLPVANLVDPQLAIISEGMKNTLRAADGLGLAAPQVGANMRLIVVRRGDRPGRPVRAYVNPIVTATSGEFTTASEGCLSVPGVTMQVSRSYAVEVEYDLIGGGRRQERVTGRIARVFQHEIDHLDGVLFIDRAAE